MKEYAFTKWLVPTLQADGTERDMVYSEQMGIFTVRGENQFQKGSIDTQHTVSLLVLKGEISIQTNDKRTVIPAPSYIEFIEPYQWSDLKTDRDFEGCLLITRREIFLQAAECIRSKVAAYVYRHVLEPFIPLEKQDLLRIQSHIDMLRHTLQQKENHFLLEMLENTLRSLILEVWNIILRMYKQEKRVRAFFPLERYPPSFSIPDAYQLPLSPHRKMVCRPTLRIPRCVIGQVKETLWQDSQPAHQRKPDRRSKSLSAQSGQQRAGRGRKALFL